MMREITTAAVLAFLAIFAAQANAAFKVVPLACETTSDTVGALDLEGAAPGGYLAFGAAGMADGDTAAYQIRNGNQRGEGIGTYHTGTPNTLTRDANENSTNGLNTPLALSGSSTICLGTSQDFFIGGVATFGLNGLTVTADVYDATAWNGSSAVPTKDALRDKIETLQPLDSDLTSWAAITRAAGFDTFTATPSSVNLRALLTDETGSGVAVFGTSPSITTDIRAASLGGADLGTATLPFGDLYLADDTTPSHSLKLTDAENLTAARTLSLSVGDASRTLTISGNATISQDYSSTASPTFANPTVTTLELAAGTVNTLSASGGDPSIEGNRIFRVGGADVPVADGGTGLSSGTSGGVLGFTASGTLASSGALTANGVVIGGGAGATPSSTAAGTNGQLLIGQTSAAPTWNSVTGDVTISASGATTIGADKVLESNLKAVDTAADEECLTYESTVGDFEWQSCGGAGSLPADPGFDALLAWDDTDGSPEWWTVGTGLDLTQASNRVDLDFTEISSLTWGAGSFTTMTFDAGATDPLFTFASNRFNISSANVIINSTAVAQNFDIPGGGATPTLQVYGLDASVAIAQARWTANGLAASNILAKSRGTAVGDFTAVQSGDRLGSLVYEGADGTQFIEGANIACFVDGTPGTNDMPGRCVVATTSDGAADATDRWIFDSAGTFKPAADNSYDIGTSALGVDQLFVDNVEIGAVTDTTLTRSAAGTLAVEGADVAELSTAQTWTATQTMRTINPSADSTYSLGASATEWLAANIDTVTLTTLELGGAATTDTSIARSAAGEATLEGDAIKHAGKQMLWIPASAMKARATSGAACGDTYDSGSNDVTIVVCNFDTTTQEYAHFQIAMPKAWNEGTVTFAPIWTNTGGASTQTVQFDLACVAISNDDALNATMGTAQSSSDTWLAQNDQHEGPESSAVTCGGTPAENDLVAFQITRNVASDNMAGDAALIGIKLYWTDNASTLAE